MRIAALISGGVDSSVALCRLAAEGGHEITAFYLKIWLEDELAYLGNCPWEEDLKYATEVCAKLNIPLEVVSMQAEYLEHIVAYVLAELKAGRTPSPDVWCNRRIKFGAFYERLAPSFEKIASGHYATVDFIDGRYVLKKGVDPVKDQAYFLSHLRQEQLARCLFPLGVFRKAEVRQMAATYDLPNRDRPDSQGICFLGKIRYDDFVRHHLGVRPGDIRDIATDRRLGSHQGYWFHTIGQRKGLGLSGGPWYVTGKDVARNIVYVCHEERQVTQTKNRFIVRDPHWITAAPQRDQLQVKIRHGAKSFPCRVTQTPTHLDVCMDVEDPGVAPGQFAVLFDGDICLGGGAIH